MAFKNQGKAKVATAVMVVLLLLSFFVVLVQFMGIVKATDSYFGYTTQGASEDYWYADIYDCRFQATENLPLDNASIWCYHPSGGNLKILLYADNGIGNATTLLATSDSAVIPTSLTLVNASFSVRPTTVAGTYYWLSVASDTIQLRYRYHTGVACQFSKWNIGDAYADPPDPRGAVTYYDYEMSIFASYGVPTPEAPSYSLNNMMTTSHKTGTSATLKVQWNQSGIATLDTGIIETNATGVATNYTLALSGASAWHNETVSITASANDVVYYKGYANNSLGLWNTTATYTFVVYDNTMALHAEGGLLKDDNGNIIDLRGWNDRASWVSWNNGSWTLIGETTTGSGTTWNETNIKFHLDAMALMGSNVLRAQTGVSRWTVNETGVTLLYENLISWCAERGIYVIFNFRDVNCSDVDAGQQGLPYPDANNGINDTMIIDSGDAWIDFCTNVSKVLRYHSNVLFDPFNEPHEVNATAVCQASWRNNTYYNIQSWHNYTDQIYLYQFGYGYSWSGGGGTMDFVTTDPIYSYNLAVSNHNYHWVYSEETGLTNWCTNYNAFSESDLLSHMQTTLYACSIDLGYPLIIGETAPNYAQANQTGEQLWFKTFITSLQSKHCGYAIWWWLDSGVYSPFSPSQTWVPNPDYEGTENFIALAHTNPFVFSVGNQTVMGHSGYYIYSNNTIWSSTWNGTALNVTYSGVTEVRVWWNVSSSYPINSTLQARHSNGTILQASNYYDATTNLITLNSTDSGSWLLQYTYPVTVSITSPANTTYTSSTILANFSASTNGTLDQRWFNVKNGTNWVYANNQTYTDSVNMTGFVNGTSYTFIAGANNTEGYEGESSVMFSVGIPPDTYTLSISIISPTNTTYTESTVLVNFTASTNGTLSTRWWNCKNASDWIYLSNQTYTTETNMMGFVNGTAYTFYAWANITEGSETEETVMFTVEIPDEPEPTPTPTPSTTTTTLLDADTVIFTCLFLLTAGMFILAILRKTIITALLSSILWIALAIAIWIFGDTTSGLTSGGSWIFLGLGALMMIVAFYFLFEQFKAQVAEKQRKMVEGDVL